MFKVAYLPYLPDGGEPDSFPGQFSLGPRTFPLPCSVMVMVKVRVRVSFMI